jgi:hypothetical protein
MRYAIFNINGGIGKCIAATGVCEAIKKAYPDYELIVVSGYPDVFINNPHVKKSFAFGQMSYFYQDYVEGKDVKLFFHDPYHTTDYITRSKHLIEIWCNLFALDYNGEMPSIYMTQRELDYFQKHVNLQKPMFIMQTNGGGDMNKKYSWARDIPHHVVMSVIEHFRDNYDIVHVRREDQQEYPHTIKLTGTFRQIASIAMLSEKRLVMDSFLQHTLGALTLPAVSLWVVNSPAVFGYDVHTHILANPFTKEPELRNSYIEKFNIGGDELEFPYQTEYDIFNVDSVIAALEKQVYTGIVIPKKINDGKINLPL